MPRVGALATLGFTMSHGAATLSRSERARPDRPATERWWRLTPEQVVERLNSGDSGLDAPTVTLRRERFGANELPAERGPRAGEILLRQFRSPLIYILLVAAAITVAIGKYADAGVIAVVLLVNAVVGFGQERRAQRSLQALGRLARSTVRVIRAGREHELDAGELVPGDIVLLEAGSKIPADCRVLHSSELEADESLLTGESAPVGKRSGVLPGDPPLPERSNMLFMGTIVVRGRCRAVVVATGTATELGAIASSLHQIGEVQTPLQARLARLARLIGVAVLAAGAVGFAAGAASGEPLDDLFLAVVALAVSAVPEGLPIVLTVALALSVLRMAKVGAIIRQLPAVETLGSCTVIGSDKTGTLTQNRMTVERIHADGRDYTVTGSADRLDGEVLPSGADQVAQENPALGRTLLAGALCNDAAITPDTDGLRTAGDPTEVALLVAAAKAGLYKDELLERLPRVAEIPFDSDRRYAASVHRGEDGDLVLVKGAPERVLEMCTSAYGAPLDREEIIAAAHQMAAQGLRVLAMAERAAERHEPAEELEEALGDLTFLGLQGMMDPPRPEARQSVHDCRAAGIRPVMITGDHAQTAMAIARELHIAGPHHRAITGAEIDLLDDRQLAAIVPEMPVYARVSPQHKLRIVQALQLHGEVVAVTGDGVNDAPALRAADIGAAMGASGTDVAREAAEMVITDDNFATVVDAVREGRTAFDNVRMTTFYLISSGVGEVIAVLASLFAGFPLPFLPVQLLWLNLVTNGVQDVALAFEPGEDDVLRRPPRPRREGVLSRLMWERTIISGIVMAAGTLILFTVARHGDGGLDRARTIAVTTMVIYQLVHVGNSRSERRSAFAKSPLANPILFAGTTLALGLQIAAMHIPVTQTALHLEPLDVTTWLVIIATTLSVTIAVELHKLLRTPPGGFGARRRRS